MMPPDIAATMREALEWRKQWMKATGDQLTVNSIDEVDAALQYLDTLPAAPAPLSMPDGPGWWAGRHKNREFVVKWTKFEVLDGYVYIVWDGDDYAIKNSLEWFQTYYRDTEWYRLTMPWTDAPQAHHTRG